MRIGILGGTFDPVHAVHCAIAKAALERAGLDLVLFVVAARPPHKSEGPFATPEERLAMVETAVAGEPRMRACDLEIKREGPSYMRDTLGELKALYPKATLYLIVGFDMLLDLPHWKDPEGILAKARLLVVHRPGLGDEAPPELEGKYDLLPFNETELSSTQIRERIASGEKCEGLVPEAVEEYIRRRGIYEVSLEVRQIPRAEEFIALITERLPWQTRHHSLSTADYMVSISAQAGITPEQALAAGVLHDLAKSLRKGETLKVAKRYGIEPTELQQVAPKLLHGPIAAEVCRQHLGIADEGVYEAIYWHTTGHPGLGKVGLALYLADFSEPSRNFAEATIARNLLTTEGFAKALLYVGREKIVRLRAKGALMDPMSEAFLEWLETEWQAP